MAHDNQDSLESMLAHFHAHGWVRLRKAFNEAAQDMHDTVWRALESMGVMRDRPESWIAERPPGLQHLKADPVFQNVCSSALLSVTDALFAGVPYEKPRDWGAFFLAFPVRTPWHIPTNGWHIDAHYASAMLPVRGVKTFALIGDVTPRGGGTLMVSGSHRLVHRWFQENPPPREASSVQMRKLLQMQPYLRELHKAGDAEQRIVRFMHEAEEVNGIPLRVVEATGDAGDIILVHPLIMHVAAPNTATQPRFMMSGGITTDQWGWAGKLKEAP